MEATQTGANVQEAANQILGLMDAQELPANEPKHDEEVVHSESQEVNESEHSHEVQAVETSPEVDAEESPLTVEQIAQQLNIDPNNLLSAKVKVKVDGVESEAKLADLVKSYQLESHLNNKSMQLSEKMKVAEAELNQHKQYLQAQAEQGAAIINTLSAELFKEQSAINWDELYQLDPGTWAAKRQEFADRHYAIQQAQSTFAEQIGSQIQQQNQAQQAQLIQFFESQKQAVFDKLPDWKNPEVAKKEGKEIADYLKANSFSEQETHSIIDHRQVLIVRKAMLYDKLMQSKPTIDNRVKSVPKVLKPGAARSKADIAAERNSQKFSILKKTGNVKDAASLLMDMF
jgi:hypothetical protein